MRSSTALVSNDLEDMAAALLVREDPGDGGVVPEG
jgi:hypothetical protein